MATQHSLLYPLVSLLLTLVLVCQASQVVPLDAPSPEEGTVQVSERVGEVMTLCRELSGDIQIGTAIMETGTAAAVGAALMMAGGMMGGRNGIFVGAVVGGFVGWMSSGEFKPLPQVIKDMPTEQQHKLYSYVKAILCNIKGSDVAQLVKKFTENKSLKQLLMDALKGFVQREYGVEIYQVEPGEQQH